MRLQKHVGEKKRLTGLPYLIKVFKYALNLFCLKRALNIFVIMEMEVKVHWEVLGGGI